MAEKIVRKKSQIRCKGREDNVTDNKENKKKKYSARRKSKEK